jgi:uncharacterized protein (DUF1330 family)
LLRERGMNDARSDVMSSHVARDADSTRVGITTRAWCFCELPARRGLGMTVYVIVQFKMTNREAYDRYQARFFDVFRKFSGRLLSADEHPAVIEGAWDRDKLVLMSFPDEAGFRAWADSPDYLEIAKDRKAGAEAVVLLAKGFST